MKAINELIPLLRSWKIHELNVDVDVLDDSDAVLAYYKIKNLVYDLNKEEEEIFLARIERERPCYQFGIQVPRVEGLETSIRCDSDKAWQWDLGYHYYTYQIDSDLFRLDFEVDVVKFIEYGEVHERETNLIKFVLTGRRGPGSGFGFLFEGKIWMHDENILCVDTGEYTVKPVLGMLRLPIGRSGRNLGTNQQFVLTERFNFLEFIKSLGQQISDLVT